MVQASTKHDGTVAAMQKAANIPTSSVLAGAWVDSSLSVMTELQTKMRRKRLCRGDCLFGKRGAIVAQQAG